MLKKDIILNLPGFTVKRVIGFNPIVIEAVYRFKACCQHCGNKKLRKKDSFLREVKHELVGLRKTVLRFKAYKFYCAVCRRYFNQSFPGILKYQRATEKL